jgi:competence protein ComEA
VGVSSKSDGKIDINTAGETELTQLPGIGSVTAQKILDYRKANGSFKTIDDIKNVSGIGDKKFEQIKDKIKVR